MTTLKSLALVGALFLTSPWAAQAEELPENCKPENVMFEEMLAMGIAPIADGRDFRGPWLQVYAKEDNSVWFIVNTIATIPPISCIVFMGRDWAERGGFAPRAQLK